MLEMEWIKRNAIPTVMNDHSLGDLTHGTTCMRIFRPKYKAAIPMNIEAIVKNNGRSTVITHHLLELTVYVLIKFTIFSYPLHASSGRVSAKGSAVPISFSVGSNKIQAFDACSVVRKVPYRVVQPFY